MDILYSKKKLEEKNTTRKGPSVSSSSIYAETVKMKVIGEMETTQINLLIKVKVYTK